MALSAKPNRKKSDVEQIDADVDEREVQAVINRGGRAAEADNGEVRCLKAGSIEALHQSDYEILITPLKNSNRDRKRFPNFSRHQFLLEAIEEKLDREL